MDRHFRVFLGAIVACTLAVASASAQTKMVATKDEVKSKEAPPRKILVLTVASDPISRASYEDVIAGEVSLRGANAVASHLAFPELPKERGPFEAKLIAEGFDAVMISRIVGSEDKIKMTEGHTSYATDYQGMGYWGEYVYTYEQVFVPGYLEKEKKVRVRTDLWRASEGKGQLVWTGTSETLNPRTAAQAGREVGAAVAKALAKAGLI
jgi:hypothetical protein